MDVITCEVLEGQRSFVEKYVFNNKRVRATMTVSGPFRSVQRSGRVVGELSDRCGDDHAHIPDGWRKAGWEE